MEPDIIGVLVPGLFSGKGKSLLLLLKTFGSFRSFPMIQRIELFEERCVILD